LRDTIPPVITLHGENSMVLLQNESYIELGATAFDDMDGEVNVTINGSVDTSIVGTYTITYLASDYSSNSVESNRTVTIIAREDTAEDGFIISPLYGTSSEVSLSISLKSKPEGNVTIVYYSSDETVAKARSNQMIFTTDNWYQTQNITIDIFDKQSSSEIVFEPTISNDINYADKLLNTVSINSHQIYIDEPYDKILYSDFNLSLEIPVWYVGDYDTNLTMTLTMAPTGMSLNNGTLFWNPSASMEGDVVSVGIEVSDGIITESIEFDLRVAQTQQLATEIIDGNLVIVDNNSTWKGLVINEINNTDLSQYQIYKGSV